MSGICPVHGQPHLPGGGCGICAETERADTATEAAIARFTDRASAAEAASAELSAGLDRVLAANARLRTDVRLRDGHIEELTAEVADLKTQVTRLKAALYLPAGPTQAEIIAAYAGRTVADTEAWLAGPGGCAANAMQPIPDSEGGLADDH